jgi:hypothetical protein
MGYTSHNCISVIQRGAIMSQETAKVALITGDHEASEQLLRNGWRQMEPI